MIEVCLRSGAPLDDNEKRKISKKAVKEDHLWYKLVPDNIALCEFPFSPPPLFKVWQQFILKGGQCENWRWNRPDIDWASSKTGIKITQYDP